MRKLFIAGNWKMNLDRAKSVELVRGLADAFRTTTNVDVAVCPPAVYLSEVAGALQGSSIGLGAQNVYSKPDGAFTGELSCPMLKDVGCRYVILGHSERRAIFGETDAQINEKLHARGKQLDELSRDEFDEIADAVGLRRQPSPQTN